MRLLAKSRPTAEPYEHQSSTFESKLLYMGRAGKTVKEALNGEAGKEQVWIDTLILAEIQ